MLAPLLFGYTQGIRSGRRLARACEERVDLMAVTAMQKPDHDTISEFRRRHLAAIQGLFVQVLHLCQKADLAELGHVSLDGSKVRASASKHKAMSYGHLKKKVEELAADVRRFLEESEAVDRAEDEQFGQGKRGDELRAWAKDKVERLKKIREAKAAVDAKGQVIVACDLTDRQNDGETLEPMVDQIEANCGEKPKEFSADVGYGSEANLKALDDRGIRGYVATGRQKHGASSATKQAEPDTSGPLTRQRRSRLRRGGHRSRYRLRKQTGEPVFGQMKECRGFRRFLLRGLAKVKAEWRLACVAHNVLKLQEARFAGG